MEERMIAEYRELWPSRSAFVIAAVGATAGFGNVWRFPALIHEYGSGIFLFPYVVSFFIIGVPILFLEIAAGQYVRQSGDLAAMGHLSKHFRGVGLASMVCGFCVLCYCVPLMAWCLRAFFLSFGDVRNTWQDVSGRGVSFYFFESVLGIATLDEDWRPSGIDFVNVICLLLTWIIIGTCMILSGMKWSKNLAYFTLAFPAVTLFGLLIRSLTLPGARNGVSMYLGSWEWSTLTDRPDIWSTAAVQTLFSLGVCFGTMPAFGSRCEVHAPTFQNTMIISSISFAFAILSSVCAFGIIGYLTALMGDFRVETGSALIFTAYSAAFSTIAGSLHWLRFIFLSLFSLGLIGAFSVIHAIVMAVEDSKLNGVLSKNQLAGAICFVSFLCGLIYTTDTPLLFLDAVDFYANFVLLFLAFCKVFAAGWMYNIQNQIKLFGYDLIYIYHLASFGSIGLACLVWFGVDGNTFFLGLLCFGVVYGVGIFYCYTKLARMASPAEGRPLRVLCDEIVMGNILDLRAELGGPVGYIPYAWAILVKHVIPQSLLVLFFNLAFAQTDHGGWELGNHGDYRRWPFQAIGVGFLVLSLGIVVVGLLKARNFDFFIQGAKSKPEPSNEDFESVQDNQASNYIEMSEAEMVENSDFQPVEAGSAQESHGNRPSLNII